MVVSEISIFGRATQAVRLIGLAEDEMVADVAHTNTTNNIVKHTV